MNLNLDQKFDILYINFRPDPAGINVEMEDDPDMHAVIIPETGEVIGMTIFGFVAKSSVPPGISFPSWVLGGDREAALALLNASLDDD